MKIKIKGVLIFIILCIISSPVTFSVSVKKYKIEKLDFISKGKTDARMVRQKITPIDTDKLYASLEDMEAYLDGIKQELVNTRLLTDISYYYDMSEVLDDGTQLVTAAFSFNDTKSLIIFPCPTIDSNKGSSLTIALQDQNFLGLMNPLKLGIIGKLGTEEEPDNMSKLTLGGYFLYDYPFSIGKTKNTWLNMFNISWTVDEGKPDFSATSGLDIGIPVGKNFLKLDFMQTVSQDSDYKKYDDDLYFTETGRVSLPLMLGMLNKKAPVIYTPFVEATHNWDFDGINRNNRKLRDTPKVTVGQRTVINGMNWNGNFRNGYFISTTQSIARKFNLDKLSEMLVPYFSANARFYKSYKTIIGIEANVNFFMTENSVVNIGYRLRGILDKQRFKGFYVDEDNYALETTSALTFNLGMPVRLITTHWLQWFNKTDTESGMGKLLSYLDFELHVAPFVDIGLLKNRATGEYFSISHGLYTGGVELILYPEKWKSYAIRASVGFDLSRHRNWRAPEKNYEIFLGIGHLF